MNEILAETEELHRQAFNRAFDEIGLSWNWGTHAYRALLRVTVGKERIRAFMEQTGFAGDLDVAGLHLIKTRTYAELVASGGIAFRSGILGLINYAIIVGLKLGIATTTSRANV
ncbi:MAG: hypothetical protein AAGE61_08660 [Pseudomonadota bacterium]